MNQSSLSVDTSDKFKKTGKSNNLSLNTGIYLLVMMIQEMQNCLLLVTHIMGKLGIGQKHLHQNYI